NAWGQFGPAVHFATEISECVIDPNDAKQHQQKGRRDGQSEEVQEYKRDQYIYEHPGHVLPFKKSLSKYQRAKCVIRDSHQNRQVVPHSPICEFCQKQGELEENEQRQSRDKGNFIFIDRRLHPAPFVHSDDEQNGAYEQPVWLTEV